MAILDLMWTSTVSSDWVGSGANLATANDVGIDISATPPDTFICDVDDSPPATEITQIDIKVYAKEIGGGAGGATILVSLYIGGTYYPKTTTNLTTSYAMYTYTWTGSWTQAQVDALRVRIVGDYSGYYTGRVDQMYVEITYTPSVVYKNINGEDMAKWNGEEITGWNGI